MGIQRGKVNVKVCHIDSEYKPETILETAQQKAALDIDEAKNFDVNEGFASGKVLLSSDINEETSKIGNTILLNIRQTAHKIDAGMLKARIQRAEQIYMGLNNSDFVPRAKRKEIKENETELLMKDAKLTIKGIEFAMTDDILIVNSTSDNDIDLVLKLLLKELDVQAHPILYSEDNDGIATRRMFLTWLYTTQREGGSDITQDIGVFIEGPLEMYSTIDNDKCTKAKIEGALVTESDELQQMLSGKKLISKAKLSITKAEKVWNFTFNADNWSFNGLYLPDADADDFDDRINSICELNQEMDELFSIWRSQYLLKNGTQELPFNNGKDE